MYESRTLTIHRSVVLGVTGLTAIVFWTTWTMGTPDVPLREARTALATRSPGVVYVPAAFQIMAPTPTPTPTDWLSYLNSYRSTAGLPLVVANATWSYGDWLHARYMVMNNTVTQSETAGNPWYSSEGQAEAQYSDLMVASNINTTDEQAIDTWMAGPFHAIGILDPELVTTGYGTFRQPMSGFQMAAALDVIQGLGSIPSSVQFPIIWPANGSTVALSTYSGDYPDALSSCPGYSLPAGLPLLVQMGTGNNPPVVTAYSLTQNGVLLELCEFDQMNYTNPDPTAQSLGQAILAERNAIVLVPRNPLTPGGYVASLMVSGQTYTWTFTIATYGP